MYGMLAFSCSIASVPLRVEPGTINAMQRVQYFVEREMCLYYHYANEPE